MCVCVCVGQIWSLAVYQSLIQTCGVDLEAEGVTTGGQILKKQREK